MINIVGKDPREFGPEDFTVTASRDGDCYLECPICYQDLECQGGTLPELWRLASHHLKLAHPTVVEVLV